MARTPSTMLPLGTKAPDFNLPDTEGKIVSLSDFQDAPGLLVVFMCNHCPFVKHLKPELSELINEFQPKGLAAIGINSNDAENYPEDRPEKMAEDVKEFGYRFPYLFDQNQTVAKAYRAACTPDFYLFDENRALVYRGQFDDSRPGNDRPVTGSDLRNAIRNVLEGRPVNTEQKPSIGCNIKWIAGNEPDYYG